MSTFSTETHCCLFVAGIFKGFNWLKGNEVMTCIYGFFYQGNKANPSLDSITNKTVLRNTLLVAKTQKQKCFQKFHWSTGSVSEWRKFVVPKSH